MRHTPSLPTSAIPAVRRLILLAGLALACAVPGRPLAAADISAEDGFAPSFNREINSLAIQADGKILVGGRFDSVNGTPINRFVRLDINGQVDPSLAAGTGFNSEVAALVVQADGKIVAGGNFTSYNGTPRHGLARLAADGTLDPALATTFSGGSYSAEIHCLAVAPDGKIYVGGYFIEVNGVAQSCLARFNADGSFDATFAPGHALTNTPYVIVPLPDGKVLVGGTFSLEYGSTVDYLARFNDDGSVDTSFAANLDGAVYDLARQPDGKLIIVGHFFRVDGAPVLRIARLNADGSRDASFATPWGTEGGSTQTTYVSLLPDGKILVGGPFDDVGAHASRRLARLHPDGTVDTAFATNISSGAYAFTTHPDGRILVGGLVNQVNGIARQNLARLNADGSLDDGFESGGAGSVVLAIERWEDGNILIGGHFANFAGAPTGRIVRLKDDGSRDDSFVAGTGFNGAVRSISRDLQGRVLVGGDFTSYNGIERNRIARLNGDGSLDETFNAGLLSEGNGPDGSVCAVLTQDTGKILVAGTFVNFNGALHRGIVRLHDDGSLDDTFACIVTGGLVYTIVKTPIGGYFLGGDFSAVNGQPRGRIARISSNGNLNTDFTPATGANGTVYALAPLPDGKVVVGGNFTAINGTMRNYIARMNADGSLDLSFNPDSDDAVFSLALQVDGKIWAAGNFTTMFGVASNRIVLLDADGTYHAGFNPGEGADDAVYALLLQPDGRMLIGGGFATFNEVERSGIARITNPDAAVSSVNISLGGSEIECTFGGSYPLANHAFYGTSEDGETWAIAGMLTVNADGSLTADGLDLPIREYFYLRIVPAYAGGHSNGSGAVANLVNRCYVQPLPAYILGTFTATDKPFDATAAATIVDNLLALDGIQPGHVVALAAGAVFEDAAIGVGKEVTLAASILTGEHAGKYAIDLAGAPTTTADITGRELAMGSTTVIDQAEILNLDGGQFTAKPKLYGLYTHPLTGKWPRKATGKILTKVSAAAPWPEVIAEWAKGVICYDRKVHKTAEKAGTGTAAWLAQGHQHPFVALDLHVATKHADPPDQTLGFAQLNPPAITAITLAEALPDGSYTLRVEGHWFGTKKPTAWREFTDLKGAVKRQRLKVFLTDEAHYQDARGKSAAMRAENGDSAVIVLVPAKPPKGIPGDTVVVSNALGLAADQEP